MSTATTLAPPLRLTITSGARTTTNQFKLLRLAMWRAGDLQICLMRNPLRTAAGMAGVPPFVRVRDFWGAGVRPVVPPPQTRAPPPAAQPPRAPSARAQL